MDFESAFPLRFWINLGRREDRRVETEARLPEAGIVAERFPGVDARGVAGWDNHGAGTAGGSNGTPRVRLGLLFLRP